MLMLCYLYCVEQMSREESQLGAAAVKGSQPRETATGMVKQTSSGRIELRITKNFSVIMDKELFSEVSRINPGIEPNA